MRQKTTIYRPKRKELEPRKLITTWVPVSLWKALKRQAKAGRQTLSAYIRDVLTERVEDGEK